MTQIPRLAGKIAIVTGAGSGFGEGIARRFAAEGAAVILADINAEAGTRVAEDIETLGGRARFIRADVASAADMRTLVGSAEALFGGLDILVNNAGVTHRSKPVFEVTEAEFDRIYAVNVKAIYLSALAAVPALRKRGGGSLITIASTAGLRPRPGLSVYNGSKGAAIILSKSLALELAGDNIRVNSLCPVLGQTGLTHEFTGTDDPARIASFIATIPLGRMSRPSDIAAAAVFLASDEAAFLTGVALEVDGGRCV